MITEINADPSNWKKDVYIASKKEVTLDDEGNEIVIYDKPRKFRFNYQSISSNSNIAEFGENSKMMKKAVIPISYQGQFKEFDVAYLDGATPEGEENYGDNANYRLLPPRDGNSVIIIYFERLTGK